MRVFVMGRVRRSCRCGPQGPGQRFVRGRAKVEGDWFVAYCPEIPGADGQGRTKEDCLGSLSEAIALVLEDRRKDGLRGVPPGAIREIVTVE
jgi:predicted RNase H-like HicB family nuclease